MKNITLIKMLTKAVLIEELSKINNVNYEFDFCSLVCVVNMKKLVPRLIELCDGFEAGVDESYRMDYLKDNHAMGISYDHIWSNIENITNTSYSDIQFYVRFILEEGLTIKKKEVVSIKDIVPMHWNSALKIENKGTISK